MSGEGQANSGVHRFLGNSGFQPYSAPAYKPQNFAAPMLSPMNRYTSPVAPAVSGGLLGGDSYGGGGANVGDPSSSPVSSSATASGMGALTGPAAMGISAITGLPVGLLGLALNSMNSASDAPAGSSVGIGAAPGTPGGIGVAIGGDGSEGGPGVGSSVGVGAAEGTPGGIGGIGGTGSEGTGDGGGGGGGSK
jgi:hypothetical protein